MQTINGDLMKEFFEQKEEHKLALDEVLQQKFGEYAESNVNTVSNENNDSIVLSFGIYNLKEELVNFSEETTEILNTEKQEKLKFSKEEIQSRIQNLIDNHKLNLDLDWEEDPSVCEIALFCDDENYKTMNITNENDKLNYDVIDSLAKAIENFIDNTMKESIKFFDQKWYYEYSALIED